MTAHAHDLAAQLDIARKRCLAAGEKLTPAREEVLTLLLHSQTPVTAYALLDRLKANRPNAAPPTIYRALNFLVEIGLVHRLERLNAFVACTDDGHHHPHPAEFLICTQCGSVIELEDPKIALAVRAAASLRSFFPNKVTVEVEGTCGNCHQPGA